MKVNFYNKKVRKNNGREFKKKERLRSRWRKIKIIVKNFGEYFTENILIALCFSAL
jgi:hypothetical protein